MQRDGHGHRPAPPREANDLVVTSVITAGWAFGVMCGVFTAAAFKAPAELNPAVTVAFA